MRWPLLGVALTLVSPAMAQEPNCSAQWTAFSDLMVSLGAAYTKPAGITRTTPDGGCKMSGLSMPVSDHWRVSADSLSWGGKDVARFVEDRLPPIALRVLIEGMTIEADLGDGTLNRDLRDMMADVTVAYVWNRDDKSLVPQVLVDYPVQGDRMKASAVLSNVDFSTMSSLQMSIGALLTQAELEIRFAGQLDVGERPFGSGLWGTSDNSADRKAHMRAQIDALPSTLLSKASKSALQAYFEQVPEPRGLLRVRLSADPEFGLVRLMPYVLGYGIVEDTNLERVLDGVGIDITYEPL